MEILEQSKKILENLGTSWKICENHGISGKIENPFNDNQKSFLRLLSKIAKNKNLLGNAGRKYLYEGGIYKELFLVIFWGPRPAGPSLFSWAPMGPGSLRPWAPGPGSLRPRVLEALAPGPGLEAPGP